MVAENTDLERRVLAHEQILQALMAQLAESEPGFLDRMQGRFAAARRGSYEHDYVETADYAEAFLHEVVRLGRKPSPKAAVHEPSEIATDPPRNAVGLDKPIVIRIALAGGVWRVTRDRVFLGDYFKEGPARDAAQTAARDIAAEGRRVEVIVEPLDRRR